MGRYVTKEEEDRTIPEGTVATAKLTEVKEVTIPYVDKKDGISKTFTKLEWWFEIIDGDHAGRKIRGECPAELSSHPANKFRLWSEALLERTIDVGVEIDPQNDLVGCLADIRVGHVPNKKDPSRVYENVIEVIPVSGNIDQPPF